jgi:hypothetical protein
MLSKERRKNRTPVILLALFSIALGVAALCSMNNGSQTISHKAVLKDPTALTQWQVPAEKMVKPAMPSPTLPTGTALKTLDEKPFLDLLYKEHNNLYQGQAKIEYSSDFEQAGKQKHIFITSYARKDETPLLCAHIFDRSQTNWIVSEQYQDLQKFSTHFPGSKIGWRQYGPQSFGLLEIFTASGDERQNTSPSSEIRLLAREKSGWKEILDAAQTISKEETVTQSLRFLRSKKEHWEGRIKTVFNGSRPLVVKYIFFSDRYVAAGTIPKITMEQALHVRGLPATDWDGSPAEVPH